MNVFLDASFCNFEFIFLSANVLDDLVFIRGQKRMKNHPMPNLNARFKLFFQRKRENPKY